MGNSRFKTVITTATVAVALAGSANAACSDDVLNLRGPFGQVQFSVAVADDPSARAQGLMFVEQMDRLTGMVFVYDRPQSVSFWMRNTLIPLDMVFADATGVVRNIHTMAQPLDETPIFGGDDIQFVLEINGGMADMLGLAPGDEMQHPSLGPDAAWPCPQN